MLEYLRLIISRRELIADIFSRDLKQEYARYYLGVLWMNIQPLAFITVIYLVVTIGLRGVTIDSKLPYSIWLLSAMIPWLFFLQNFTRGPMLISKYGFLVKKVEIDLIIAPIPLLLINAIPHMFLLLVTLVVVWVDADTILPGATLLQIPYYFICMCLLVIGLNLLVSSCNLFIPDISNIVSLLAQFGFWLTPIFWDAGNIPQSIVPVLKLNPMFYIVEGYRSAFEGGVYFWDRPYETLYFWVFVYFLLRISMYVFRRLQPHFAEVI